MTTEQVVKTSIEDSLKTAMAQIKEREAVDPAETADPADAVETADPADEKPTLKLRERDETGKFKPKEAVAKDVVVDPAEVKEPVIAKVEAPQSWTGAVKDKFATLPPDVQAEIQKREKDVHQMMTRHDGELRLGREMKDVITPYMHIINAQGNTPAGVIGPMLNTAYILSTGSPQQKADILRQVAEQYGVDLGAVKQEQENPTDPHIRNLEQRLAQFEQQTEYQRQLQEQEKQGKVLSEISAFAADPRNTYYRTVEETMLPLVSAIRSKSPDKSNSEVLQEAYDAACMLHPDIRSTIAAAQLADQQAKRKAELATKKQASVSVTGSPGVAAASTGKNPKRTPEEDIREALASIRSSKI